LCFVYTVLSYITINLDLAYLFVNVCIDIEVSYLHG
jgi:hypothetical protein